MNCLNKYCIVRGKASGVFAGTVIRVNGSQVTIKNVRRLWHWKGAATISQIALDGTVNPNNCKFTVVVDQIVILDAIEVILTTDVAKNVIEGVKVWKM